MIRRILLRAAVGTAIMAMLGACATLGNSQLSKEAPAELEKSTRIGLVLDTLPPPQMPLDVAIYQFPDRTGQFASNDNFAENSRAVTQGASSVLIDVLKSVGDGKWFEVVEREDVQALLQERELIQRTRVAYEGPHAEALPALRFAGTIIEGGIVGYDTNTETGGAGANYLAIGANAEYRTDVVTVALRTVSVANGRVLTSVTTTKTIHSVLVNAGVFKFVAIDQLFEAEAGFSKNEPTQIAVREAIELAVLTTIVEGVEQGIFDFKDPAQGAAIVEAFRNRYKSSTQLGATEIAATH